VHADDAIMTPDYAPLFYWIKERESIRICKDGDEPRPWTDDPILATYRFCNVRREDDRVTIWVREHIREPFAEHPHLWLMLCIARQINWPDTLQELIEGKSWCAWPLDDDFDPSSMAQALSARKDRGEKVYTGAYMISAPPEKGADKQAYIAEQVIGGLWKRREIFARHFSAAWPHTAALQRTHDLIRRTNGWGAFMAYQAVVDMRFTALLNKSPDIDIGRRRSGHLARAQSLVRPAAQSRAVARPSARRDARNLRRGREGNRRRHGFLRRAERAVRNRQISARETRRRQAARALRAGEGSMIKILKAPRLRRLTLRYLQGHAILIWSGEHRAWWRPNCQGYTQSIDEAGRYSFADAFEATKHCGPEKKIAFDLEEMS
jgi:alpha-glutamyl/putrescinyl thymine pyrophosphorylase clade 1